MLSGEITIRTHTLNPRKGLLKDICYLFIAKFCLIMAICRTFSRALSENCLISYQNKNKKTE